MLPEIFTLACGPAFPDGVAGIVFVILLVAAWAVQTIAAAFMTLLPFTMPAIVIATAVAVVTTIRKHNTTAADDSLSELLQSSSGDSSECT